jgi:hypothetical protein
MVDSITYSGKNHEMEGKMDKFKHSISQMFPIS